MNYLCPIWSFIAQPDPLAHAVQQILPLRGWFHSRYWSKLDRRGGGSQSSSQLLVYCSCSALYLLYCHDCLLIVFIAPDHLRKSKVSAVSLVISNPKILKNKHMKARQSSAF